LSSEILWTPDNTSTIRWLSILRCINRYLNQLNQVWLFISAINRQVQGFVS